MAARRELMSSSSNSLLHPLLLVLLLFNLAIIVYTERFDISLSECLEDHLHDIASVLYDDDDDPDEPLARLLFLLIWAAGEAVLTGNLARSFPLEADPTAHPEFRALLPETSSAASPRSANNDDGEGNAHRCKSDASLDHEPEDDAAITCSKTRRCAFGRTAPQLRHPTLKICWRCFAALPDPLPYLPLT
ncbi:hypothetical protein B0H10DRAFT_2433824 [Mycena sp. CBHHK59/15]|nr:hypothetical protein B0H10DRAFT_2433824 [Mycena sp. CBHHK59/15]